jgi:hypothetical protein
MSNNNFTTTEYNTQHDWKPARRIDPDLAHAQAIENAAWHEHSRIVDLWMDGKACRAQVVQAELIAIAAGDEVTRIYVKRNHAGNVAAVVAQELVTLAGGVR